MTNSTKQKKFDYSETRWGSTEIKDFKSYLQGFELELLLGEISKYNDKRISVLDLGCGGGNIVGYLNKHFPKWQVYGVDPSKRALSLAKKKYPQVKFSKSSAQRLKFPDKKFDVVLALDVIEHVENYPKMISEAKRVMKQDGLFFVGLPLEKQFPTIYALLYKLGWDKKKRQSVGHINVFDSRGFISVFKKGGLTLQKMVWGGHLVYTVTDLLYYFLLKPRKERSFSFESGIYEMDSGVKKTILLFVKNTVSKLIYYESKLFGRFVGGRGHFFFRKSDFFSLHPPVTVARKYQLKNGLSKFLRPKDIYVSRAVKKWRVDKSDFVLDFGCADGIWLERVLKTTKSKGIGVDVSPDLIKYANKTKGKNAKYFLTDKKWPVANNSIDYCISLDVFEHIEDKKLELGKIYKSMKRGSKFLFYTLNPNNKLTLDWLFEKMGSNFLYDHADHDKSIFVSPKDFKKMLERVGFRNVSYELFDGPFNLFWEVAAYLYLGAFKNAQDWFLDLNSRFMQIIYPLNMKLDRLFTRGGNSNGYFIRGEKL